MADMSGPEGNYWWFDVGQQLVEYTWSWYWGLYFLAIVIKDLDDFEVYHQQI